MTSNQLVNTKPVVPVRQVSPSTPAVAAEVYEAAQSRIAGREHRERADHAGTQRRLSRLVEPPGWLELVGPWRSEMRAALQEMREYLDPLATSATAAIRLADNHLRSHGHTSEPFTVSKGRALKRFIPLVVLDFLLNLFLFRDHAVDLLSAFGNSLFFVVAAAILPGILGLLDAHARVGAKNWGARLTCRTAWVLLALTGQLLVLWLRASGLQQIAPEQLLLHEPPVDIASVGALLVGLACAAYSFVEGWHTVGSDPLWARRKEERDAAIQRYEKEFLRALEARSREAQRLLDEVKGLRVEHDRFGRQLVALMSTFEDALGKTDALVEQEQGAIELRLRGYSGFAGPEASGSHVFHPTRIGITDALARAREKTEQSLERASSAYIDRDEMDEILASAEEQVEAAIADFSALRRSLLNEARS